MLNKRSLRWRLTILSALLLTSCCVGLTIVLNLSTFRLVDEIDSALISTPAQEVLPSQQDTVPHQEMFPSVPSENIKNAKKVFSIQSILYMMLIILGGSGLTYYLSGQALKPLDTLNTQVKNRNINNLSETLEVPSTKDEVAELTQSFNEMTEKLNHAFMIQKHFSASAAHELRTPLAILQTKVDVFRKRDSHTIHEYEALLTVFERQISRLRGLVSSLLDLADMDNPQEQSTICLQEILEDIIAELSGMANEKNITFSLHCDDSTIQGNVNLMYRAFYNLIENGIKYNVNNGYLDIKVEGITNNQTQILIKDGGIGIPDEMKKHIFEPFYRVDKSRSRELGGAGLGLSIVDRIIRKHGGVISVMNNEDYGTCFKIVL